MYRAGLGLLIGWFSVAAAVAAEPSAPSEAQDDGSSSNAALFEQLDTNHDGQLSRDEIPDDKRALFERLLKQADGDKSGRLSRDEFLAGLESRRPKRAADEKLPAEFGSLPSPEKMEGIFSFFDRNQDGKVSPGEVPDDARERFDRLAAYADTDGDGAISKEEFQKGIERIRRPFAGRDDLDPKEIFEHLDRNADGKLTEDEVPSEHLERFKRGVQFGDGDRDGALSLEEFTRVVSAHRKLQKLLGPGAASESPSPALKDSVKAKSSAAGGKGKGKGKGVGRLAKLDADHDGKVSFAEFSSREKKRFNRLDKNQDGVLDRDEIQQAAGRRAVKTGVQKSSDVMDQEK